jgi:hypothetical protein
MLLRKYGKYDAVKETWKIWNIMRELRNTQCTSLENKPEVHEQPRGRLVGEVGYLARVTYTPHAPKPDGAKRLPES